jgi:DNA-binding transcriptional MocR family regulator
MYYIYCDYLTRRGFEVLAVPEDAEGINMDCLESAIAGLGGRNREIRFIYLVTVGNPTGTILSERRRREILTVALRLSGSVGHKVPLILDKAYEELIHDKNVPIPNSLLNWDETGLVYEIGTLSKVLAPALRIGYMVGRDGPFLQAMVQRTSDAGFSASLVNQEMASHLLQNKIHSQLRRVNKGYRQKALLMKRLIEKNLGARLSKLQGGQAGFYFYLTFKNTDTTETSAFFKFLTRTTGTAAIDGVPGKRPRRVLYLPGQFCVHPQGSLAETGRRQLRLSYGYEEEGQITRALELMGKAAEYAASRQ